MYRYNDVLPHPTEPGETILVPGQVIEVRGEVWELRSGLHGGRTCGHGSLDEIATKIVDRTP